MSSLVLELQHDSTNPGIHITDLIRKASLVSRKLKAKDIEEWLSNEMNGFRGDVPEYRKVKGILKHQDENGRWWPCVIGDAVFEQLEHTCLRYSLSQLEHLLNQSEDGYMIMYLPVDKTGLLKQILGGHYILGLHIPTHHVVRIIDTVKNTILDFSLSLEEKGVLGENMTFSKQEQQIAQTITNNIINIQHMENSQLQQDSLGSKQS